jgi:H+-translocating NAD(P) transhydrogenase subunit alpha
MIVGVPRESFPGERRVALVPAALANLSKIGLEVIVESGAGVEAGYPDAEYVAKGAKVISDRAEIFRTADIIVQVLSPGANDKTGADDLAQFRRDQIVIGFFRPMNSVDVLKALAERGVTSFSVELIPRTTRAQSMDALSSMATVAGYKAVLVAADILPKLFPMLTTAAGTITPARVLILGVGVAGLQAIATARRLGAVVSAYDLRPVVKEQVQSLGARFVELPIEAQNAQDARGYATAQDESFYKRQRELLGKVIAENDVVITTAVIPGKKAPILVTKEMVAGMAARSVIIDLAAERGGNCELTRPGEKITVDKDIAIVGWFNLASTVPYHASQMYARNLSTFLALLVKDGQLNLNLKDDILGETLVTHGGDIVNARLRELFQLPALAPKEETPK